MEGGVKGGKPNNIHVTFVTRMPFIYMRYLEMMRKKTYFGKLKRIITIYKFIKDLLFDTRLLK